MADTRLKRLCDVCGKLDDEPRHVTSVAPNTVGTVPDNAFLDALPDGIPARAIAELMDASTLVRHIQCCADNGCASCRDVLAATSGDISAGTLQSGVVDHLSDSQPVEE